MGLLWTTAPESGTKLQVARHGARRPPASVSAPPVPQLQPLRGPRRPSVLGRMAPCLHDAHRFLHTGPPALHLSVSQCPVLPVLSPSPEPGGQRCPLHNGHLLRRRRLQPSSGTAGTAASTQMVLICQRAAGPTDPPLPSSPLGLQVHNSEPSGAQAPGGNRREASLPGPTAAASFPHSLRSCPG